MAIKPSISKGTRDFSPADIAKRNYLKAVLQEQFECYGFQPIATPTFERLETLMGKYGEEGDRLIFRILNSGEKLKKANSEALSQNKLKAFADSLSEKALRYDLTVPFARYVAQHQNELVFPFRRYQIQNVWRADRPQHGRFQEFMQCDADIVGVRSILQEIEMLRLYDSVFNALGLHGVSLKINHRGLLAALAQAIGAPDQLIPFTVALDKLDKIGFDGVVEELLQRGFDKNVVTQLQPLLQLKGTAEEKLKQLAAILPASTQKENALAELQWIFEQLQDQPMQTVTVDLDITLARGLNYYTGMIVEVGAPEGIKMGSIGGGGRYDDLTAAFGLKDQSGIGISFGFDRIFLVMEELGLFPKEVLKTTQVLFLNTDEKGAAWALKELDALRRKGVAAEIYPAPAKFQKQLRYANGKNIPYAVIYGSQEQEQGHFVLKNMQAGSQQEYPIGTALASIL